LSLPDDQPLDLKFRRELRDILRRGIGLTAIGLEVVRPQDCNGLFREGGPRDEHGSIPD
jgi:hypothetical protein